MTSGILGTRVAYSGLLYEYFKENINFRKIPVWKDEEIARKFLEREKEKIQPRYNSKGKLLENIYLGIYLNFLV